MTARNRCYGLLIASIATLAMAAPARGATHALIPAYFASPGLWRQADAAGPGSVLIVNPASGPGRHPERSWKRIVATARRRKVTLVGYVATGYGEDRVRKVERQVARYRRWYGLHGVFFDEVSQGRADLGHYRAVAQGARRLGMRTVVLNPGTTPARGYFHIADVVVSFEASYDEFQHATEPHWIRRVPPSHIASIVIDTPPGDAHAVVRQAHRRGAGLVFATDDGLPNPYDTLPSYFERELRWLAAL